jgi:hypothetical protein
VDIRVILSEMAACPILLGWLSFRVTKAFAEICPCAPVGRLAEQPDSGPARLPDDSPVKAGRRCPGWTGADGLGLTDDRWVFR